MSYKLSSGVKVGNRVNGVKVIEVSNVSCTLDNGIVINFGDPISSWQAK